MAIWYQTFTLDDLNNVAQNTMVSHLGITFVEFGDRHLTARMPVDHRTIQPAGLLHGGASAALAETVGSVGAYLCVDPKHFDCVGLELNANHLKAVKEGYVYGRGEPLHLGRRIQVWQIEISNETDRRVAVSRLTLAVVEKAA